MNNNYTNLMSAIQKVTEKESYPVPVEGTEASTTNAAFHRYLRANAKQQKRKLTEKTANQTTDTTNLTTNIAGLPIGSGDGLDASGKDAVAHKGNITVSPKGTKRIGAGWALPTAVFNSMKVALNDAGIEHDENNPYSMMHAMNKLKSGQTRELAQTIANYSGTQIDFDKFVSDVQVALDYNREVTNKYNSAVDAVSKAIDTQRNNLLRDIWTGKLSTDEANAAVHGGQNEPMGNFAGERPGEENRYGNEYHDPRGDDYETEADIAFPPKPPPGGPWVTPNWLWPPLDPSKPGPWIPPPDMWPGSKRPPPPPPPGTLQQIMKMIAAGMSLAAIAAALGITLAALLIILGITNPGFHNDPGVGPNVDPDAPWLEPRYPTPNPMWPPDPHKRDPRK